jgi:hypothetical protein
VTTDFPPQMKRIPPFTGAFDAYRLAAEGCDDLFATYPPGKVSGGAGV